MRRYEELTEGPPPAEPENASAESPAFRTASSGGMDLTENKPVLSGTRSVGWVISAVAICTR